MPSSHILQFIGGLIFFFFGLFTINQSLQFFAGDRLKGMIARTTESRLRSVITGIVVTFFFQSSSAITVMLAGLSASGLVSLEQAMAVALGAGIGTTFVVMIISVREIVSLGVIIIGIGFLFRVLSSRQIGRIMGEVIFGCGFIFFGLSTLSQSFSVLQTYAVVPQIFQMMGNYPFLSLVGAAVVTTLVQSSSVVLGVLISLAYAGSITFPVAVPLVLGANVGTSFTAVMATWRAATEAKRVAWANLLLRAGAVALIYFFLPYFVEAIHFLNEWIIIHIFYQQDAVHVQIALCHFFTNFLVALVFLPFINVGKKIVCFLFPKNNEVEVFGPKYLDINALMTPSLAFAQARRELVRTGEIVQGMFLDSLKLFQKYDLDLVSDIESRDHKVDTLYKAVKFYLAKLSQASFKEEEVEEELWLITSANELENIGDIIDRHLLRLARKKWNKGVEFSDEGWKEIGELHRATAEMIELALVAISSANEELARKVVHHFSYYNDREDQLKMSHLRRLHHGLKESIETSTIHLETLSLFHQISLSLLNMVHHMLPDQERKVSLSLS